MEVKSIGGHRSYEGDGAWCRHQYEIRPPRRLSLKESLRFFTRIYTRVKKYFFLLFADSQFKILYDGFAKEILKTASQKKVKRRVHYMFNTNVQL